MEKYYISKIGYNFKKENIFLAKIILSSQTMLEELKERFGTIPESCLKSFIASGIVSPEQYDIFYKDERGYTRFLEEGKESLVGDNSDGKGTLEEIVPVWDYFDEKELFEGIVNKHVVIMTTRREPLDRYIEHCMNKNL